MTPIMELDFNLTAAGFEWEGADIGNGTREVAASKI